MQTHTHTHTHAQRETGGVSEHLISLMIYSHTSYLNVKQYISIQKQYKYLFVTENNFFLFTMYFQSVVIHIEVTTQMLTLYCNKTENSPLHKFHLVGFIKEIKFT